MTHEAPDKSGIDSPHEAYARLLHQNQQKLMYQQKQGKFLGFAKIALALFIVVLAVWFLHELHGIEILLLPFVAFVVLAVMHEKVLLSIREIKSVIVHYNHALARLEDRWAGNGEGGERFLNAAHPYARDLDVFGPGSIFELLCTFRTRAGEETLARWLLEPAAPDTIRARQRAAQELRTRIAFREKLFTVGNKVRLGLHPHSLAAWGEGETWVAPGWLPPLAAVLALLWIASIVYGLARNNYWPLLGISAFNWTVNRQFMKPLAIAAEAIEGAADDLGLLAGVLLVLEREKVVSPSLVQLQTAIKTGGVTASVAIRKLHRIVTCFEHRRNKLIGWFDSFIFYSAQCMNRAQYWRKEFGPTIRGWLAAVGEMEVLAALSGYAFEHPDDAWPEISEEGSCLCAESLAHPLLPESKVIRNDLNLGDGLQLIILSGSNMSGKSTFVRGIGLNAILAQCGAPVRAKRLRLSPLAVGASICILDSLQGGVSRFYAEIKRLKMISDLAQGPIPALFLLDELLSGTNSHDRLLGTHLVVTELMRRGAMGIVTTHDLALTDIPESMAEKARNYHFEDNLVDGNLAFDFKLKPGVVQTSNALKLMQSIGLLSG